MLNSNSNLTLKILEKINQSRIHQDISIIWPDYQILDLLDQQVQIPQIYKYASTESIVLIHTTYQNLAQISSEKGYTHLACVKNRNDTALTLILTTRPIAVDSICYPSKNNINLQITVTKLTNEEHLWGVLAVPVSVINNIDRTIITPACISNFKQNLTIIMPIDNIAYQRLIFYGVKGEPRYGRKIYDKEIPQHSYKIYSMKVKIYDSYFQSLFPKSQEYLIIQSFKKNNNVKFLPHKNLQIQKCKKKQENLQYSQNSKTKFKRIDHLKSSTKTEDLSLSAVTHQQDYIKLINNWKKEKQKEKKGIDSDLNKLRQKYIKKYKDAIQKVRLLSQFKNYIRIISQRNIFDFQAEVLKIFCVCDEDEQIEIQSYPKELILLLLKIMKQQCINDQLNLLPLSQKIILLQICQQMQLKYITPIIILIGIVGNISSETWADLKLFTIRNCNEQFIPLEVMSEFQKQLEYFFVNNSESILLGADEIFYMKLQSIPKKQLQDLVNQSLSQLQRINYNHLIDLLGLLIRAGIAKNIINLIRNFESNNIILGFWKNTNYQGSVQNILVHCSQNLQETVFKSNQSQEGSQRSTDEIYTFLSLVKHNSMLQDGWIIICQPFCYHNNYFRLIIKKSKDINQINIFIEYISTFGVKFMFCASWININLMIKYQSNWHQFKQYYFYYIWGKENGYIPGAKFHYDDSIFKNKHSFQIKVILKMKEEILNSACLHYVGLRIGQLLKINQSPEQCHRKSISQDMGKRRSCIILQKNIEDSMKNMSLSCLNHTTCSDCKYQLSLYNLNQLTLFCLLQSDYLEIAQQSILLLFVIKYYSSNPQKLILYDHKILFLSLRYNYIPLKNLLNGYFENNYLKTDELYTTMIKDQLQRRCQTGNIQKKQIDFLNIKKPRIQTYKYPQENFIQELMKWMKENQRQEKHINNL